VWKNFRDFPIAERHEQDRVFDHINTVHTKGTSEMISTDRITSYGGFLIGCAGMIAVTGLSVATFVANALAAT
jgi:hypothetical protein